MSLLFSVLLPETGTLHYVHRLTAAFVQEEQRLPLQQFRSRHNRVGDYWKDYSKSSGSLDDLLEACYHCLEAKDIKGANQIAFTVEYPLSRWGFLDAALNLNQETYELTEDGKDKAIALHNMGMIHQSRGDYDRALELYGKSLAIAEKIGDIFQSANVYGQLGLLNFQLQRYETAAEYFAKAFLIFHQIGSPSAQLAQQYLAQVQEQIDEEKLLAIFNKLGMA